MVYRLLLHILYLIFLATYSNWGVVAPSVHRSDTDAVTTTEAPPVSEKGLENCISLDSAQKRREADDNFKFTKYVI